MPRRRIQKTPKAQDELSFPVPYREHAKYLDLAHRFLAADPSGNGSAVIPIDRDRRFRSGKWKKAS